MNKKTENEQGYFLTKFGEEVLEIMNSIKGRKGKKVIEHMCIGYTKMVTVEPSYTIITSNGMVALDIKDLQK